MRIAQVVFTEELLDEKEARAKKPYSFIADDKIQAGQLLYSDVYSGCFQVVSIIDTDDLKRLVVPNEEPGQILVQILKQIQ